MLKNINFKIQVATFLLLVILIAGCSFVLLPNNKIAEALSTNYGKNTGDQLTVTEWNNLPTDFLALTGDRPMQGAINMNGNRITNLGAPTNDSDAVTRGQMNSAVAGMSGVKDETGSNLRMVCGTRALSLANTQQHIYIAGAVDALHITLNDLNTGLSTAHPFYFVNITGNGNQYKTTGGNTSYNPTPNGLEIYLKYIDPSAVPANSITPAQVVSWGWAINWCAVGN